MNSLHYTDAQVIVELQILPLEMKLVMGRLRYAIRFAEHAPKALVRLVLLAQGHSNSWYKMVQKDLKRLWDASDKMMKTMPDPDENLLNWLDAFKKAPKVWRQRINDEIKKWRGRPPEIVTTVQGHERNECERFFVTCL